jgi:hypothetical protein
VADEELTPEELFILADAAEWGGGTFAYLAWLGSNGAKHQPERAAELVERLLSRGLVEIEEYTTEESQILSREQALAAIREPRKWRD